MRNEVNDIVLEFRENTCELYDMDMLFFNSLLNTH